MLKEYKIGLAGNPNVGKSTVFNALTGMKQHTGNWPGKTVAIACGTYNYEGVLYNITDIPGTYSLYASSPDEEVARDFILFGECDVIIVVVDATCILRNLSLVISVLEAKSQVVVCVNLLDEAKKKGVLPDLEKLSYVLGVPVVGTSARSGIGLSSLKAAIAKLAAVGNTLDTYRIEYSDRIEKYTHEITFNLPDVPYLSKNFLALKILEQDESIMAALNSKYDFSDLIPEVDDLQSIQNEMAGSLTLSADKVYKSCAITCANDAFDRKMDRLLTSKATGIPIMLILLSGILYLTIVGANYPSALLSNFLFQLETPIFDFLYVINLPDIAIHAIVFGIYRTTAWVVSVMLPPMAIFFPLFTMLEDLGYLPRVAFNLDKYFEKSGAHGKQSLSMCMGYTILHKS